MHNLINEEHGHDSVLANYIEQIKNKDKLLAERDQKLTELAEKNNLLENEKASLLRQLERGSITNRSQESLRR